MTTLVSRFYVGYMIKYHTRRPTICTWLKR